MGEPPAKKAKASPQAQDFIKGWPNTELVTTPQLRYALTQSFGRGLEMSHEYLNYGDPANGAYMLGHPGFRKTLAAFLQKQYGKPVDWKTLMSTGGSSMGMDLVLRKYTKPGDVVVVEEPTYYLAFTMARDSHCELMGVPIEADGMDIGALEKLLQANPGKVKVVYTVSIHHNPTGVTMSNEKRARLVKLAREHKFYIASDEAYQLLEWTPTGIKPMFYHDDPADPRVFSLGTFSKVIGPGLKVGWIHAAEQLIKPLPGVGFIDSGNNPVIFNSCNLIHFIESGALDVHLKFVCEEMGKRCALICKKIREVGLEVVEPKGGYFVWVKIKNKKTGRTGECMCIKKDRFGEYMRLCFAWLKPEQIEEGIEYLRE